MRFVLVLLMVATFGTYAHAATRSVCASGCAYTDLQKAIDEAQFGDVITLRGGETYTGHFILRAKSGSGWITIRSSAADSNFPSSSRRLVPSDRGGSTSRSLLPRLVGRGGAYKTTPLIETASGAHGYILKFLELDGTANIGYETLVQLGSSNEAPPTDIVLDRVYIHGHRTKGQKRGIALNGVRLSIINSYICDIKAANADSQAILGYNGAGPFTIENNYLEAAGENILFGGADPSVTNLVPSDISIRRNHFFKPLSWKNPILGAPSGVRGAVASSGGLSSGAHYFRVVAVLTSSSTTVVSAPSSEVAVSVSSGQAVTVSWSGVSGAERYRIYRGRSSGAQSVYLETSSAVTSFKYTGVSERSGTPPSKGTLWIVKNLLELKNAQRVTIDGNVFENNWPAGQVGYALVFTPRNSGGDAPWVRVRDVLVANNIVRNVAGVVNILGYDNTDPSLRTERVTFRNNLFLDVGKGGVQTKVFLIGKGPDTVVFDRNTIVHENTSLVYAYSDPTTRFVYTNNIAQHGKYGIMGASTSSGLGTLTEYFPGANVTCNVLAGGSASRYPTPNAFPSVTDWWGSFVDAGEADYRLKSGSVVAEAGCGSTIPGADFAVLNAALAGVGAPPASEPSTPEPEPSTNAAPVARPGGPYAAAVGGEIVADGSDSTDSDGSITRFVWTWGDEILVRAADLPASALHGSGWVRAAVADAAEGIALHNPNRGASKRSPAAAPSSYVEFSVHVAAGVPYRLWMRLQAEDDRYSNDSLTVQFSNAVSATGSAIARIGSTDGLPLILEEGEGAGVSGWGWNDQSWGGSAAPVYFAQTGVVKIRLQQREDGVMWDQLVLSSGRYASTRPGAVRNDHTIVSESLSTTSGEIARHTYQRAGVFPVTLTVMDDDEALGSGTTTARIGAATSSLVARAGGPYTGTIATPVSLDGSSSTVPAGATAAYEWNFGDDTVLRATAFRVVGTRWRLLSDSGAASGSALVNADAGAAKPGSTTITSPGSYAEATFYAAAGVPYRVWVRMRAEDDDWANDSIHAQFSGSATSTGSAAWRIGTSQALSIILEEGRHAGVSGWGWNDNSYGSLGEAVYFQASGLQTIRIQQREDGVRLDQVVITSNRYYDDRPGLEEGDMTILPVLASGATGSRVQHTYRRRGNYPVQLTVRAGGAAAQDTTSVSVQ